MRCTFPQVVLQVLNNVRSWLMLVCPKSCCRFGNGTPLLYNREATVKRILWLERGVIPASMQYFLTND